MGDYSYGEHLEMFGGPPEPGEAYPDLEQVDLARKAAKEDPESAHAAAVRKGMTPTYVPAPQNDRTRTQIVAARLIALRERWRRDA